MKVANEQIKTNAKTTPKIVGETISAVLPAKEVHKEKVPQKIYVGPNMLGLPKYTVVESVKTPHIQNFIKECPEVEKLFVAIEKMPETESRIKQKGTLEHRHFNKVVEFKAGKVDK